MSAAEYPRDHNQPPEPIAEPKPPARWHIEQIEGLVLDDVIAPFAETSAEMLAIAASAVIIDDESAAKVSDLTIIMRTWERDLDARREELKRPYLDACRLIDATFGAAMRPVVLARAGENRGRADEVLGLAGMLDAFAAKRRAEEAAERARLAAEQRRLQAEADAARQAAEEKAKAGEAGSVADKLAALKAQESADAATRQAEAIRPTPIRSQLGQLGSRREIAFEITDARKLLGWMLKQPLAGNLTQAVRTIMGAYLRNLGVAAVDRGIEIPGLTAKVETSTQVRGR